MTKRKLSVPELRQMINESVKEVLKEVEDPTDRAKRRMIDAYDRGGVQGMIDATRRRIAQTQSPAKLQGIMVAIRELIRTGEIALSPSQKRDLTALFAGVGTNQLGRGQITPPPPRPAAATRRQPASDQPGNQHSGWVRDLLAVADSTLENARQADERDMKEMYRKDARDLKKIAHAISTGKLAKAYNMASLLDTAARDNIPDDIFYALQAFDVER